jgi:hypothetical protein
MRRSVSSYTAFVKAVALARSRESKAALGKHPVAHGLEFLQRKERDANLVSRTGSGITPGLKVLREPIEVIFLDRSEVGNDIETVLVDGSLGVGIESNALESSTESNSISDSSHDERAKDLRKLETVGKTREKVRKQWEKYWQRRGTHRHFW